MTPRNSGRDWITIETDQTVHRSSRKGESLSISTVKVSSQPSVRTLSTLQVAFVSSGEKGES